MSAIAAATPFIDLAGNLATSAFNVSQQRENNRFQRDMSNTAHQREVLDLQRAGLNPILSVNHGAATPPTQAPRIEAPRIAENMNNSARVANEKIMLQQQSQLQQAQIRDLNAAAAVKEVEAHVMGRTQNTRIDEIRERLYQMQQSFDNAQEKYPYELQRAIEALKEQELDIKGKKIGNAHSAYGLSHAASESEFYQGLGGDIEHWMKLLDNIPVPNMNIFRGRKSTVPRKYRSKETTDSKGNWKREETEEGGRD